MSSHLTAQSIVDKVRAHTGKDSALRQGIVARLARADCKVDPDALIAKVRSSKGAAALPAVEKMLSKCTEKVRSCSPPVARSAAPKPAPKKGVTAVRCLVASPSRQSSPSRSRSASPSKSASSPSKGPSCDKPVKAPRLAKPSAKRVVCGERYTIDTSKAPTSMVFDMDKKTWTAASKAAASKSLARASKSPVRTSSVKPAPKACASPVKAPKPTPKPAACASPAERAQSSATAVAAKLRRQRSDVLKRVNASSSRKMETASVSSSRSACSSCRSPVPRASERSSLTQQNVRRHTEQRQAQQQPRRAKKSRQQSSDTRQKVSMEQAVMAATRILGLKGSLQVAQSGSTMLRQASATSQSFTHAKQDGKKTLQDFQRLKQDFKKMMSDGSSTAKDLGQVWQHGKKTVRAASQTGSTVLRSMSR